MGAEERELTWHTRLGKAEGLLVVRMHAHAFGVEARDDAFRVVIVGAAALRRRDELVPRVHGVAMQREHECSWLRARAVGGGCQP